MIEWITRRPGRSTGQEAVCSLEHTADQVRAAGQSRCSVVGLGCRLEEAPAAAEAVADGGYEQAAS